MARRQKDSYSFPHPMDNDSLIGHESVMGAFMDAWGRREQHAIHPVWMLSGAKGIGKATLAHRIARMVYGNISDFFIIDIERNIDKDGRPKTDAKAISVHTVRKMIEQMQMSSSSGGWRCVVIDSVDELSISASNAILKLLEEPPAKTIFLLVAHQLASVLPTVRSRARVEKMTPLTMSELRALCAKFMPDEDISTATLRLANGSFGKIANLKKSGGDEIYVELIETLENPGANAADMMNTARKIAPAPELHGILLDAIAYFGLADLYPSATRGLADIARVYLEPEIAIFKIINDIKKRIAACS
jgi:DNA polymerase-3 subunit delta'